MTPVTVEMVENIVAKMARIPAKSVSASDKDVLRTLERDLKLTIFGQDRAIEALAGAIKMSRSGCARKRSRSARSCSPGPPAWARPRSRASSHCSWASN